MRHDSARASEQSMSEGAGHLSPSMNPFTWEDKAPKEKVGPVEG